jgi:hypothetical protein
MGALTVVSTVAFRRRYRCSGLKTNARPDYRALALPGREAFHNPILGEEHKIRSVGRFAFTALPSVHAPDEAYE